MTIKGKVLGFMVNVKGLGKELSDEGCCE